MEPIQDLAERWMKVDQDESTRREIEELMKANNGIELEARLRTRIAFGTAGLRSSMKAGFAHMNSLTVLQASQGLAQYIIDQHNGADQKITKLCVVVGHDARHNSNKFARHAAAAFLAMEFEVMWFDHFVHTPMVPFAVQHFAAAAGVMVTASHNPKNDNGYKVYWSNGSQIIPPHDADIAKTIGDVKQILTWDTAELENSSNVRLISDEAEAAYLDSIRKLVSPVPPADKIPGFMYTPMHGTGRAVMKEVAAILQPSGSSMHIVQAQAEPDPEFPTVPFPNPEEKGALDLAIAQAEVHDCRLIIANDPDADRFAVAERLDGGEWHQFTGNQMGVLLASHILETYRGHRSKLAMLASTVSSRMLAVIAEKEGFLFRETLTGFKWLGNVAQDLQRDGYDTVYAYEEAIGYMFPRAVWDKDGIAAAAVFLKASADWRERGLGPWKKLQQLYTKYGFFEDVNTYLISPSPNVTNKVFGDIRISNGGDRPVQIGQRPITRWRDLTLGFDSGSADKKPALPVDPSAQMITCELEDVVFTARASGTEPKIKLYVEARASSSQHARMKAQGVLQDLLKDLFRPEYGLRLAGS